MLPTTRPNAHGRLEVNKVYAFPPSRSPGGRIQELTIFEIMSLTMRRHNPHLKREGIFRSYATLNPRCL